MELPFSGCGSARLALYYAIALARCTCFIAVVSRVVLSALGHDLEDGNRQLRSHQKLATWNADWGWPGLVCLPCSKQGEAAPRLSVAGKWCWGLFLTESRQVCPLHPCCVQDGDLKGEPGSTVALGWVGAVDTGSWSSTAWGSGVG